MLNEKEIHSLCKVATRAAREAGAYIQSRFNKQYDRQKKEGGDSKASQVVTEVDIKAQALILDHLQPTFIEHNLGLLTEESADDESRLKKAYFWCIDPMDGTLPYTENRSGYAVSIALVDKLGNPIIGVVYVPDKDNCYTAIKGNGVYLNDHQIGIEYHRGETLQVFMDRSIKSTIYYNKLISDIKIWAKENKFTQVNFIADYGAVCNAIAVFQSGSACYFKFSKSKKGGGSIWDFAATRLFFEELNLPVTNGFGKELHLNNPETTFMHQQGVVYATDDRLSKFIVSLNNGFER